MKKLFIVMVGIALLLFGCKKDQPQPTNQLVDVSFSGVPVDKNPGGTKADACFSVEADWAVITIDDIDYTVDVYYIDGIPYTKSIKLAPKPGDAVYVISNFLLYSDNNTADPTDDGIIAAAPESDAEYGDFVVQGMPQEFVVGSFTKVEIPIEVLCFENFEYTEFGFFWFTYDEVIVRTQCFYGDFCAKHPDDYIGSLYEGQAGGLQMDMPAIFQIEVKRNGTPFTIVNNESWLGEGAPLCIEYPDLLGEVDNYEFILSILVRTGSTFGYVEFDTWTFTDDEMITSGTDGVTDFVLGNCVQSESDFTYAPYMNLPTTCRIWPGYPADPGYWSITADQFSPAGNYDIESGHTYVGFCGDKTHELQQNQYHTAYVYSSLYPATWPTGMPLDYDLKIAKANWLFNHLSYYGMNPESLTNAQGDIIQNALWKIINNINTTGVAAQMASDASSHGDFLPLPGGYAAVLFVTDNNPSYQLIFTIIDP